MGNVISGIGKALGGIVKGIGDFIKSPIGKFVLGLALTAVTGGLGAPLMGALGGLGGLGSLGSLGSVFSGFASNFLGPFSSLLSGGGLGSLGSFLGNAGNSGGLLDMVSNLVGSQENTQQTPEDLGVQDAANQNLFQMTAYNQAQYV